MRLGFSKSLNSPIGLLSFLAINFYFGDSKCFVTNFSVESNAPAEAPIRSPRRKW